MSVDAILWLSRLLVLGTPTLDCLVNVYEELCGIRPDQAALVSTALSRRKQEIGPLVVVAHTVTGASPAYPPVG